MVFINYFAIKFFKEMYYHAQPFFMRQKATCLNEYFTIYISVMYIIFGLVRNFLYVIKNKIYST